MESTTWVVLVHVWWVQRKLSRAFSFSRFGVTAPFHYLLSLWTATLVTLTLSPPPLPKYLPSPSISRQLLLLEAWSQLSAKVGTRQSSDTLTLAEPKSWFRSFAGKSKWRKCLLLLFTCRPSLLSSPLNLLISFPIHDNNICFKSIRDLRLTSASVWGSIREKRDSALKFK